ncbi:MAG: hypothetical protein M0Q87_13195 [Ottowia sp.]|nr:hypothetical protein [Ottowia sp.]
MRFRHIYMGVGSLLVILIWLLTDPDMGIISNMGFGASTVATLVILLKSVLYVAVLHLSRKALSDYLDMETVFKKAMETSEGAGRATMAVSIMMLAIAVVMFAATSN